MLTYASGAAAASEQAERQRTHEHAVRMQADRNAPRAVTTAPPPARSPLPHAPLDASAEAAACAGVAAAATSKAERWKQRAQQQVQHRPAASTRSGGSSASSTAAKGLLQ